MVRKLLRALMALNGLHGVSRAEPQAIFLKTEPHAARSGVPRREVLEIEFGLLSEHLVDDREDDR